MRRQDLLELHSSSRRSWNLWRCGRAVVRERCRVCPRCGGEFHICWNGKHSRATLTATRPQGDLTPRQVRNGACCPDGFSCLRKAEAWPNCSMSATKVSMVADAGDHLFASGPRQDRFGATVEAARAGSREALGRPVAAVPPLAATRGRPRVVAEPGSEGSAIRPGAADVSRRSALYGRRRFSPIDWAMRGVGYCRNLAKPTPPSSDLADKIGPERPRNTPDGDAACCVTRKAAYTRLSTTWGP